MKGNPGQSWILDSTLWIPDSTYWIPVFISRTWILEFEFHFQFPCDSLLTEQSDFHQSTRMLSPRISISHRPSMQIMYSNSRDVVASSPSFSPPSPCQSAPQSLPVG